MTIPSPAPSNGHTSQAIPLAAPACRPAPERNPDLPQAGDSEEREILLAQSDPDPDQPRKEFDPERDDELKASMQNFGQQNAIIVCLVLAKSRYRIIAGERRWRAAKALGWKTIRARVLKDQPDEAKRRELALIDNEQRQDLSEVERGLAYRDLMTRTGCSARELARKVGKNVSNVTRAIKRAQSLSSALQERVQNGTLPPRIAQELLALPDAAQLAVASQYPAPLKTRTEVVAEVRKWKNGGGQAASPAGFTCGEESGIKIVVTWDSGVTDALALTKVENALRIVLKDLAAQKHRGVTHWKNFLEKKAKAAKKAADLAEAQQALAQVANPTPSTMPPPAQ